MAKCYIAFSLFLLSLVWCASTSSKAAPAKAFPGLHWDSAQNAEELGWSRERLEAAKAQAVAVDSAAGMIVTGGRVVASWGEKIAALDWREKR